MSEQYILVQGLRVQYDQNLLGDERKDISASLLLTRTGTDETMSVDVRLDGMDQLVQLQQFLGTALPTPGIQLPAVAAAVRPKAPAVTTMQQVQPVVQHPPPAYPQQQPPPQQSGQASLVMNRGIQTNASPQARTMHQPQLSPADEANAEVGAL